MQAQAEAHAWPMSKVKPRLTWTQTQPSQAGQTQLGLLAQSAPKPKSKPRLDPSANTSPASEALIFSATPMGVESICARSAHLEAAFVFFACGRHSFWDSAHSTEGFAHSMQVRTEGFSPQRTEGFSPQHTEGFVHMWRLQPTALAQIVLGWAHDGLNVDNG